MENKENKCPICENHEGRPRPNKDVQYHIFNALANPEKVTDDTLFIIEYLIRKWKTGKAEHPDPEINEALKKEDIDDESIESVKQAIVSFATETASTKLFRDSIELLKEFEDNSLVFLYQGWLNKYFRDCLLIGSTVNVLLELLESAGETVRDEKQDKLDWGKNLDSAREYLIEKLNIIA